MIDSLKNIRRADKQGYYTKVTALGYGFGLRVYKNDYLVSEDWTESKSKIAKKLKELLRWVDKLGSPSDMASASRDREK